jgi:hypothetical protein
MNPSSGGRAQKSTFYSLSLSDGGAAAVAGRRQAARGPFAARRGVAPPAPSFLNPCDQRESRD